MTTATEPRVKGAEKVAEPKAPQKKAAPTAYVVLEQLKHDTVALEVSWVEIGRAAATSPIAAIKMVVGTDEKAKPGTYRAVPERSWQRPVMVAMQQRTEVLFT
jgi:hypothetical protein